MTGQGPRLPADGVQSFSAYSNPATVGRSSAPKLSVCQAGKQSFRCTFTLHESLEDVFECAWHKMMWSQAAYCGVASAEPALRHSKVIHSYLERGT